MAIEAAKLMVTVGADTSAAEKGVQSFGQKLQSTAKNLAVTGGALSLGVTAPLLGIAKAGLDSAIGFEQSMNVMQQVTGATASQMETMSDMALQLGADTVFSASEAAEAMLELGKAGMDTGDIMDSISGVMDLAAAGGVSLAEAANLTASTLNAFGLAATESNRIANIMAATANASAADISDLGMGMQQAGFAFSMANQPVENLAASLAILTNVGLTGSDAGTALKNAFMRMMNPTKEASSLMQELGINFYDANGNMKMLPDIIDNLNSAMAGLSNEQRDAALATLFLSDGMKAFIPLMDAGKDGFNEMVTDVTKAGAATETAAARMGGLGGAIEQFKGSVDSFLVEAAQPFMGTLASIVKGAAGLVTEIGNLPQPIINAGLAFAGVFAIAGPLMVAVGGLALAFSAVGGTTLLAITAVAALAAAWAADVGGIQTITANVVSNVVANLKSLAEQAKTTWSSIQTAFGKTEFPTLDELWADFKAGDFDTLATKIRDTAFDLMVNLDTELNITGKAEQLKQRLVDAVTGMLSAASDFDMDAPALDFNKMRLSVQDALSTAFSDLDLTGATAGFGKVKTAIQTGLAGMFADVDFGPATKTLGEKFNTVATSVGTGLTNLANAAKGFDIGNAVTKVSEGLGTLRDNVLSGLTTAINGIDFGAAGSTFSGLIDKLKTGVQTLDFSDVNWAEVLQSKLLGPLGTAISGIKWVMASDAFSGLADAVKGAIADTPWGDISSSLGGLASAINTQIDTVFADMVTDITNAINETDFEAASQKVAAGIDSLATSIEQTDWTTVGTNLARGLKDMFAGDTSLADNFGAAVRNAFANIQWGDLQASLSGLSAAVDKAFLDFASGISKEFNLTAPKWVTDLQGFFVSPPAWLTDLTTWDPNPQWLQDLKNWKPTPPTWLTNLTNWKPTPPTWLTSLTDWKAKLPEWLTDLTSWDPETPEWVTSLTAWVAATPEWLASLTGWTASKPDWLQGMLDWMATKPDWLQGMLDWTANTPDWLQGMLDWVAKEPGWVSRLTSWVASRPAWLDSLLNWTPPAINLGGGGSGGGSGGFSGGGQSNDTGSIAPSGTGSSVKLAPLSRGRTSVTSSLGSEKGSINITIENMTVANDMDVEELLSTIARRLPQKMRYA